MSTRPEGCPLFTGGLCRFPFSLKAPERRPSHAITNPKLGRNPDAIPLKCRATLQIGAAAQSDQPDVARQATCKIPERRR